MTAPFSTFCFLSRKTNRFHIAVGLYKTSKCGENTGDTIGFTLCATVLFLPHYERQL